MWEHSREYVSIDMTWSAFDMRQITELIKLCNVEAYTKVIGRKIEFLLRILMRQMNFVFISYHKFISFNWSMFPGAI